MSTAADGDVQHPAERNSGFGRVEVEGLLSPRNEPPSQRRGCPSAGRHDLGAFDHPVQRQLAVSPQHQLVATIDGVGDGEVVLSLAIVAHGVGHGEAREVEEVRAVRCCFGVATNSGRADRHRIALDGPDGFADVHAGRPRSADRLALCAQDGLAVVSEFDTEVVEVVFHFTDHERVTDVDQPNAASTQPRAVRRRVDVGDVDETVERLVSRIGLR